MALAANAGSYWNAATSRPSSSETAPMVRPQSRTSAIMTRHPKWSASLETLADLRQIIAGETNILGFSPDFLMLIQTFEEPGKIYYDSFDAFRERLKTYNTNSPLRVAKDRLADARISRDQFKGHQSQYVDQFRDSTTAYNDRLFQIVGARPAMGNYSDDPRTNAGSELHQQYLSIEIARQRIKRNETEINNLAAEIQIEINRAEDVKDVYLRYGNEQAKLTEKIGRLQAVQAASSTKSTFSRFFWQVRRMSTTSFMDPLQPTALNADR